jgi:hypothetical protein
MWEMAKILPEKVSLKMNLRYYDESNAYLQQLNSL